MRVRKSKGQSLVETGLLVSLVSIVAISSLTALGGAIQDNLKAISARLDIQVSTGDQGTGGTPAGPPPGPMLPPGP